MFYFFFVIEEIVESEKEPSVPSYKKDDVPESPVPEFRWDKKSHGSTDSLLESDSEVT